MYDIITLGEFDPSLKGIEFQVYGINETMEEFNVKPNGDIVHIEKEYTPVPTGQRPGYTTYLFTHNPVYLIPGAMKVNRVTEQKAAINLHSHTITAKANYKGYVIKYDLRIENGRVISVTPSRL